MYGVTLNPALVHFRRTQHLPVAPRYVRRGTPPPKKKNRNLNVARELELVARCAATYRESTQYSSSLPRGVNLG